MKATQSELAIYLGVSKQAVSQYNKKKLELMLIGLKIIQQKQTGETNK